MVVYSPESRLLLRLYLVIPFMVLIGISVDEVDPGCVRVMAMGTMLCAENEPLSFWFYVLCVGAVLLILLYVLAKTFRKVPPEELRAEQALLRRWSKGVRKETGGTLYFPPRSLLAASVIAALFILPLLRLAIVHRTLLPSDHQLELIAVLVVGGVLLWFPVRWLSESLRLTEEGIQYRNLLRLGGVRPWSSFKRVTMKDDARHAPGIWLYSGGMFPIVINQNTVPKRENYCLACRFIVDRLLRCEVPIQIPVSGVESWLETCGEE